MCVVGGWIRLALLVLCSASILAPVSIAQGARIFSQQDYEAYFSPGRLESHSPYYASEGLLEVVRNRVLKVGGRSFLEQTVRSLDVSPNYDALSDLPYYKIRSEGVSRMVWDEQRHAYVFDYAHSDFAQDDAEVFESSNRRLEIAPDDRPRGFLHAFYRKADARAGRDVEALDRAYQNDVIGTWTMQCAFVREGRFEVSCDLVHLPTERLERHLYRKLDLIG